MNQKLLHKRVKNIIIILNQKGILKELTIMKIR